ncbi:MAG: DUF192 domain-containing protein, partial [Cellvibrionaceae bacterium]|nr:DUF192 domain-containing protein [Cellvibrionaceae bacterium]
KHCPAEGLLIPKCRSVHTFAMAYAIDIVYLNKHLQVLSTEKDVRPWRVSIGPRAAYYCLELPSGAELSQWLSPGDTLLIGDD